MNEYTDLVISGSGGELPAGSYTRSYDANGNLTHNDATGTLPNSQQRAYSYDAFNRLVEIKDGWGQVLVDYAYDHKGRRVQKVVSSVLTGTFDEIYTYFYLGSTLIEEHKEFNSTTEVRQYVWGGGALLQYADSSGTYHVHENGYGSIMATTSAGASPAIYDRFDYDAYGRFARTGTTTAMPFAFRSMLYDAEIGLYSISNGAYYNPALGSYLSRVLVSPAVSRYAVWGLIRWSVWFQNGRDFVGPPAPGAGASPCKVGIPQPWVRQSTKRSAVTLAQLNGRTDPPGGFSDAYSSLGDALWPGFPAAGSAYGPFTGSGRDDTGQLMVTAGAVFYVEFPFSGDCVLEYREDATMRRPSGRFSTGVKMTATSDGDVSGRGAQFRWSPDGRPVDAKQFQPHKNTISVRGKRETVFDYGCDKMFLFVDTPAMRVFDFEVRNAGDLSGSAKQEFAVRDASGGPPLATVDLRFNDEATAFQLTPPYASYRFEASWDVRLH